MCCVIAKGKRSQPSKIVGYDEVVGVGEVPGEQYAALVVLHQVQRGKPIHLLLAPEYRPFWTGMDESYAKAQESKAKAAFHAERKRKNDERRAKASKNSESAAISISVASRHAIEDALLDHNTSSASKTVPDYASLPAVAVEDPRSTLSVKIKSELVGYGFSPLDADSVSSRFTNVDDALDYLCLYLDEADLPASFAPAADVEIVQFYKPSSETGGRGRISSASAHVLSEVLCSSRLSAEKALRASDGAILPALGNLFWSLTSASSLSPSVLDQTCTTRAAAARERDEESEVLNAIYGKDAAIGQGVVPDFPEAWAAVVTLPRGIPGLSVAQSACVCIVDVDGMYLFSSPVSFLGASLKGLSRARRRAAMRALSSHMAAKRSAGGAMDDEPIHIVHAAASFLADSSEADLLAAAASSRPRLASSRQSSGPLANDRAQSAKISLRTSSSGGGASSHGRQRKKHQQERQLQPPRPLWMTPKLVGVVDLKGEGPKPASALRVMAGKRAALPAFKSREKIIATIRKNQVTVVSGATGSGKTTQVPQFVLEDAAHRREPIAMVCTQPRRIAAMSVAERVAAERSEKIGRTVGYQVKLNTKRSDETRLVFCTTGVLLRQMQADPSLNALTHVFVDECHERSVETDFTLLLLRDILVLRPELRVVLMSATLDASKFSTYFSEVTGKPVPIISIPGRTFPVEERYLEDAIALTRYRLRAGDRYAKKGRPGGTPARSGEPIATVSSKQSASDAGRADDPRSQTMHIGDSDGDGSTAAAANDGDFPNEWDDEDSVNVVKRGYGTSQLAQSSCLSVGEPDGSDATIKVIDESQVNIDLIDSLVRKLDVDTNDESTGAILLFLPGMSEISSIVERLSRGRGASRLFPMPLHSAISPEEQAAVFGRPPKGRRKVICSTNIAETSVTVEDVTIVIDTIRVKEMSFDALNGTSVLAETFISQAAARQRAGRAGRVSKGTCFRLVKRTTFDNKPSRLARSFGP
jgi:Helicase conserved C-terminal domain/DEAD/DEAH box helicase